MKIYKRLIKAFGGLVVYLDKQALSALKLREDDEVILDIQKDKIIITKPLLNATDICKLLNKVK